MDNPSSSEHFRKQRELDEARTAIVDHFPSLWRGLFEKLQSEGFSDSDSLKLVQTYILSQCPNGIRGSDG